MTLHIEFFDGSNPWVSLPTDRHTIAKHWRRWMKYHPNTAKPVAMCGGYKCERSAWYDGYYIYGGGGENYRQYYHHLGHALAALERLGGEKQ